MITHVIPLADPLLDQLSLKQLDHFPPKLILFSNAIVFYAKLLEFERNTYLVSTAGADGISGHSAEYNDMFPDAMG